MKILAVRGKNLASLAGHFEVDFSKPPLDHAGLIAITGPTGAGKTTLLDAMCLALFDRTPRFGNRGGVVIGGQDDPAGGLKANDVRGILRHGAVEGWAEVDFLGVDERRWRARWEVRRARGRAEGRIQQQQMTLIDPLTERSVAGGRKGDVLRAIEDRLGLDFDQFRRSVLLAQGEFAAFLEASGGERAELLERMTGTGLYRQLGRAAFERAKQAEVELALTRREREGLRLLDDEDREALEAKLGERRAVAATLERGRAEAEAALRWYGREAELSEALAAARAREGAGAEAVAELAETERLLERVERVAGIRERIATRDRRARELAERSGELEFVRGELPLIETQLAEVRARLSTCEQARLRARERRRRLGEELDRARELDGRLTATQAERERLLSKQAAAREQLRASEAQLAKLDGGLEDARARSDRLAAALADRTELAALASYWPHYRSLIQRQLRALEQRDRLRLRLAELEPRRERCEADLDQARAELELARRQRNQAKTRLRKLDKELDERASLADLRHRQQILERGRERLDVLRGIRQRSEAAAELLRELEDERGALIIERDHRSAEQRRVAAELARTELGFEEAQGGLRRLEAVRDLVAHRGDLRSGEACPLCGATEHPAAAEPAPVDTEVAAQRARVEQLLRRRDGLQREQGEHLSHENLAAGRLATIARRLGELADAREQAQADWSEVLAAGPLLPRGWAEGDDGEGDERAELDTAADRQLSLLAGPSPRAGGLALPARLDSPELATALWAIETELATRTRELAESRRIVETLVERQRDLQARRDQAEREHEQRRESLDARKHEREVVVRELEDAQSKLEELTAELDERAAELEDVGPGAVRALDGAPEPEPEPESESGWRAAGERGPSADVEVDEVDEGDEVDERASGGRDFTAVLARVGPELLARLDEAVRDLQAIQRELESTREGLRMLESRRGELGSQLAARRERCEQLGTELGELEQALNDQQRARATLLDGRPATEVARELEAAVELAERDHEAAKDELARVERELKLQQLRAQNLSDQVEELGRAVAEASAAVDEASAAAGVDEAELASLLERRELWREGWASERRARIAAARAEHERLRAVVAERERVLVAHREHERPSLAHEAAQARQGDLRGQAEVLGRELFELEHRLRRDSEARAEAARLEPELRAREHAAALWGRLRDAIGSATGDKFQKFAQSLTLELLLTAANAKLRELKPRYALGRVPKHDLELQLVDHDLGDEVRSIRGLSGGEKFLVSLALALALASLSAEDCRIDSLFIDEGFGTLDAHSLDVAVSTLDTLQAEGRQIGVISHVPGLAERVGVEIRVEPVSSGRSRVRVLGPAAVRSEAR